MPVRFGIKTSLFALFCFCVLFGWYSYVDRRGARQLEAVAFFRNHSTIPIERTRLVEIQAIPVTANGETTYMQQPMISIKVPESSWHHRMLGEHIFFKYTVLQVTSTTDIELKELETNILKMPWLERVLFYSTSYTDDEIEQLRRNHPRVAFDVWRQPFN